MKHLLIILGFIFICSCPSGAQDTVSSIEQTIADIFEQYTAELDEYIDYNTFYEDLLLCSNYPINLNRATREELERLPFLSDIQVENILSYVYQFGPLSTIYELQLVDGLDMTDIRRMLPFVVVGEGIGENKKIYWADLKKYGKSELYFRLDKGLENKEGYRYLPEEDTNVAQTNTGNYLGNNLYTSLKYRYHYKDRIQAGITAEKDAGEQFWGSAHKGYDFYSFYAQLNDFGKLKTIVAGDFRANFGQGLVLHPEFSIGKSSYVLNVTARNAGLMKYSSSDESNFFRGGGATLRLGKVDLTAFYSNKQIDGDTANGTFSSIIKTGYHRTLKELSEKHTVNQQVVGGNATYTRMNLQVGVTLVHTLLDNRLEPDKSVYNYFYFSGNKQTTGGIFYRLRWTKLNLFGETAMTDRGAAATINGCFFNPVSQVSLVVLHRYYSPEYDTFYASAFSETSRVNDEAGLYLGAEVRPFRKWKLAAYADSFRFPWPKYGIDDPSIGKDYLFQADYTAKRDLAMFWRLKFEEKQTNLSNTGAVMPVVVPVQKAFLRYQLTYSFGSFTFKNILEGNLSRKAGADWTYGANACQDVSYSFPRLPLKVDFRYQFFDAVDYENRFYTYEKDVLYAFSIPMYYGLGSRYYVNLRYEVNRHLSFWFKLAQTVYADDRETLSSGKETISGNRKTDMRLLVRWSF
ncbi:MAG: helix-hairpin-helix domain-containing protein [Bacteroidota bacterium]|nr:helix-hairpin-helix domain-containing protein [Bacteroidota bacterium]